MDDFYGLFRKGVEFFEAELFWEAIDCFKSLTKLHPDEPLLDDVYINLAVCYMKLNLFIEAKEYFLPVFNGEIGDGLFEEGNNNYGRTAARATLGLIRIHLSLGETEAARKLLEGLEGDESGLFENGNKVTFFEIAKQEMMVDK